MVRPVNALDQCGIVTDWPGNELEHVPDCPVCGHQGRRLLYEALTDRVYHCAPGEWNLHQCLQCGAAYLDPRPIPSSIWRAYTKYHTHQSSDKEQPFSTLGFRQRLRRALRNGYINARYGANLQPASAFGQWVVPMLYGKQGQIDRSLRNLPRLRKGEPRNVLDIGCGSGAFLMEAMQLGWEAQGIDTDPKAASQLIGLRVEQGGLPSTNFPDAMFDVVTLSHVIEHTHDPAASLREAFRILRPGGQIWIATPNLTSFSHRYFCANWIGLHPPAHLVLFNHASILRALSAAGFERLRFSGMHPQAKGYYQMSWRIAQGDDPFVATASPLPFLLRIRGVLSDLLSSLLRSRREEIVVTGIKSMEAASARQRTHI